MRLDRFLTAAGIALVAACGSGMGSSSSTGSSSSLPQVTIQDFTFKPSTLTVKAGTTVTWINSGPSAHTVTSDTMIFQSGDLSGPMAGDPYGGGAMAGASFQFTFKTARDLRVPLQLAPAVELSRFHRNDRGDSVARWVGVADRARTGLEAPLGSE